MLSNLQKQRMKAKLTAMKTPSCFELRSNRVYWARRAPKRTNLKHLVGRCVNYTGQIAAVRRYNSDYYYCVHVLLKPVIVSGISTSHLWVRVPLHKFNKIYKRLYPEFNASSLHISHKTVTTNTPIIVTGRGKLVLYTRRNKKLRDTFNQEYGFQEIDTIRVINHKEFDELPDLFCKAKTQLLNVFNSAETSPTQ